MSRVRRWIERFVGRGSGRRKPAARRRAPLEVEALEQRTVRTLVVTPHFKYPTESDQGGLRLNSPPIYLIFWGTYWATTASNGDPSKPSAAEVTTALKGVVGSAYLSGLTQYGVDGRASVASPGVIQNNNPPGNFGDSDIAGEVADQMYAGNVPAVIVHGLPNMAYGTGIYVVVTPPGLTSPNEGNGASDNGTGFSFNLVRGCAEMQDIWLGGLSANGDPNNATVLDYYVGNFSHELAENITDPLAGGSFLSWKDAITVTPNSPNPAANPAWTGGGDTQVCDAEAQLYTYRIRNGVLPNGLLVQSYWSQKDKAYLIPDGTPENFYLTPINPTNSTGLTGSMEQYTLAVNGDGKTMTIGDDAGRLKIAVNGTDSVEFDAGQITSITVNSSSGNSHVVVDDEGAVTKVSSITDTDTGGSSQLTVKRPLGGTLTDTLSAANSGSLPLGGLTVSYNKVATVTLSPTKTITNLTLKGGQFATELDTVSDAGAGSVQFDGAMSDHGTLSYSSVTEVDDLVGIQSAEYDFTGSKGISLPYVAVADGPVLNGVQTTSLQQSFAYLEGSGSWWTWNYYTVMDPVEFANKGDVTVQGGPQNPTTAFNATIDLDNPHPAAGLSTLEIDPGAGTTKVNVEITPKSVATTVTNDGVWYNLESVILNTPSQGVQAINGTVDVEDPNYYSGAKTNLLIDDTGDKKGRTSVNLTDGRLTGLAPAKITWAAVSSLSVTGGSGGNSFNVFSQGKLPITTLNAGNGGDTFTVSVYAVSAYQLTVNGGKGYDELIVDVMTPRAQVGQTHGVVSVSSPVPKTPGSTIHYKDIEKVDVNQPSMLGSLGNGLDGDCNLLPPSLGGPSLLPENLGGPNEGPPLKY
jgi:hypothetical protein